MAEEKSAAELGQVTACFNHKDREGRVRCGSCLRPVCEECVVVDADARKYCSQKCLDGARLARERADDLASRPPPAGTLPVVTFLLCLITAGGAWWAWKNWKALVMLYHHFVGG